ncbi:protoglobin domain-containing protein [Halodesulfurarchaeum sp.]|uniref:protoglobin domain-containing protein n=1 Tax=Halodesulfurarchaeum sp. TaxID=1980530 RepID=UPI002FC2ABB4
MEALKQTQHSYLATGDYEQDHFRDQTRIGKLHDTLEMPMKQYIGQCGVYYNLLIPLVTDRIKNQLGKTVKEQFMDSMNDDADLEDAVEAGIEEGFRSHRRTGRKRSRDPGFGRSP